MRKRNAIFFIAFLPLILLAQNDYPFVVGENCSYRIHYGPITAGYGHLSVKGLENHLGEECYFFDGFAETTTFFDYIFEVNDSYI